MNKQTFFGDEDLSTVLLGKVPKHEELCCLKGTINLSENYATNMSTKAYQCQIFKCRCLIFSVADVLASPVLGAVENIYIIVSQEYFLSDKLKPHLKRTGIEVKTPIPLTNAIYEACLRYTIFARLAPSWNQVEKYLVCGRDFLNSTAPLNAVKLDIVINEIDMHVVLWPLRLRLPQVCAQDFQSFSNSPLFWDLSSDSPIVHVLPSLNRAQVLMVSGHIPQNSLFKSYKDLKRHWKNSYGYRLPESDEGMIYLTVSFGQWFTENLTYPIMCVRARRPVFLRQSEPQQVLLNFLSDLRIRIPSICGLPFGLDCTVRYAVPKLNVLTQAVFPCNLSEEKPVAEAEESWTVSPPVSQYTETQASNQCDSNKNRSVSPPLFLPQLSQVLPPTVEKPLYVPVFTAKPGPKYTSSCQPESSSLPLTPKEQANRVSIIPVPSQRPTFHINKSITNTSRPKKIINFPMFNLSPSKDTVNPPREKTSLTHLPESGSKKARYKPQVQQGVDVKALAQSKDGLSKVNTTTLIAYLRNEGVPCKVKDKKGDLVAKVMTHLKLPLPSTQQLSTVVNTSDNCAL